MEHALAHGLAVVRPESTVLPEPPFEGSEKRVEVDFTLGPGSPTGGLRALPWDVGFVCVCVGFGFGFVC